MQEDTSFQGDVIGLCISIKGRHTEGKGRHQQGLSSSLYNYYCDYFFSSKDVSSILQEPIIDAKPPLDHDFITHLLLLLP